MDTEPDLQKMGAAIKQRRLELDMSQEALARAADLSLTVVGRLERGDTFPSYRTAHRIAVAFQWPSHWLTSLLEYDAFDVSHLNDMGARDLLSKKIALERALADEADSRVDVREVVEPESDDAEALQIAAKAERLTPEQRSAVESIIDQFLESQ